MAEVVGMTFGAFDPLHIGHVRFLESCHTMCDKLLVMVSDDDYVLHNKGHEPMFKWRERCGALRQLRCLNYVGVQSLSFGKKDAVFLYLSLIHISEPTRPY